MKTIHVSVTVIILGLPAIIFILGIVPLSTFSLATKIITSSFLAFGMLMTLWAYWKAAVSNPGYVPENWTPDIQCVYVYQDRSNAPIQNVNNVEVRYCDKCNRCKPPRAHHCRECGICVTKMDHHCIWIGNCVGQLNQKYFILFLADVVVTGTYCVVLMIIILQNIFNIKENFPTVNVILLMIDIFFVLPLVISVSVMLIEQLTFVSRNMTSIEDRLEKKVKEKLRYTNERWTPPYSYGRKENFKVVFGDNCITAVIPVQSSASYDGLIWPISPYYSNKEVLNQVQNAEKKSTEESIQLYADNDDKNVQKV